MAWRPDASPWVDANAPGALAETRGLPSGSGGRLHFLGYRHGLFFASQFVPKLLQPGLKRFDGQSIDLYSFGSGKEAGYNAIPGKLIDYNTYDKYLYKAVIEITEKNIKNDWFTISKEFKLPWEHKRDTYFIIVEEYEKATTSTSQSTSRVAAQPSQEDQPRLVKLIALI